MRGTVLARLAAAVFLMVAVVVAIIELGRDGEAVRKPSPEDGEALTPLQSALQRCQALGEAAVRDATCLDIWAENRRRFLSADPASERSE